MISHKKTPLLNKVALVFVKSRRPVSRVLSFNTVIYLDLPLPTSSSDVLQAVSTGYLINCPYLAPNGVYTAFHVSAEAVSSYLAFSSLPTKVGGNFLLHFP